MQKIGPKPIGMIRHLSYRIPKQEAIVIDENLVQKLKQQFGEKVSGANFENVDPWVEVTPSALPGICRFLRDEPSIRFDYLNSICVVDYCEIDPKKAAKAKWEPHLEVVYHLASIRQKRPGC